MDRRREEVEKNLKALRRELADTDQILQDLKQKRNSAAQKAQKLENQLEQLKPKELKVSDHALLRYMERHHGIDVEEVRRHIRAELEGVQDIGSLKFAGWVVQGHTVVTYVEPGT